MRGHVHHVIAYRSGHAHSHSATLLPDGTVLVAGGGTDTGQSYSTEIYDPANNVWTFAGNTFAARMGS